MNITEFAIKNRTFTYFIAFMLFAGGIATYIKLGRLEDPDFTVKVAAVITEYPGASPEEVELEVTDRIEKARSSSPTACARS